MSSTKQEQLEQLKEIRSLMDRSSRFISLSGLSGVVAGCWALVGAMVVVYYLDINIFSFRQYYAVDLLAVKWGMAYWQFFILVASLTLVFATLSGMYFSHKKAKKAGQSLWDPTVQLLFYNLLIPLVAGGIFCLILMYHNVFGLVAPATLIFYGLALLNGSKYTLRDIRYLGICEIILGLISSFYIGFGLLVWAIGFGVLHIVYGLIMYYKYDRD